MKKILVAILFLASASCCTPHASAQAIIVNPGVKASEASKAELREIFSGAASSLKDGSHVTPVLQKGGAAHEAFLSSIVGKADAAFRVSWRSLVFSGQGVMPKNLDSDAAVVEYVAHTPGAIGYIAKDSGHDGVKVLTVH